MTLTLVQARDVCRAAVAHAERLSLRISVVVVDARGHIISVERMDGAGFLAADIAERKAYAAVAFRRTSGEVQKLAEAKPAMFAEIASFTGGRLLAGMGAVPVMEADQCIGAVAVSGVKPEEDEEIVRAALVAVGLS
jgi:glc operon protein GlcG